MDIHTQMEMVCLLWWISHENVHVLMRTIVRAHIYVSSICHSVFVCVTLCDSAGICCARA